MSKLYGRARIETMKTTMLDQRDRSEVADEVIRRIPIDVVYLIPRRKLNTPLVLPDKPVKEV